MIHCPYCGAENPDDARSCGACGQSLPELTAGGVKCPMCEAENDLGAQLCGECGARLRPVSPTTASSAPTQGAPMGGFSLPEEGTGDLPPPSPLDASAEAPEEMPSWLQRLLLTHGLVGPEEEEVEPLPPQDRMAEPEREPEERPVPPAAAETEDWLAAMRETGEEPPLEEPEEMEEMEGVDWLRALRSEGEVLEQLTEEAEEADLPLDAEVSDWLRSLREPQPEATVEFPDVRDFEGPDWLRDLVEPVAEAEEIPTAEEPPLAETPVTGEELPDWLRDLGEPGAEEEETSPLVEEPPLAETPVAEEELPDWLRDLGEPGAEEEVPPLVEEPPLAETPIDEEGELPDWLRDLGEPSVEAEREEPSAVEVPPPVEPPEAPVVGEEELPEWLAELQEEEFEEETIVSPIETVPSPEEPVVEELEGLPEVGELEEEGEPSESPALVAPHVPAEEVGVDEGEEAEVEVPEWMQEVRGVEPVPAEEVPGEEPTLPDWLTQPAAPEVTVEAGEVAAPEWMQGPVPVDREVTAEDQDRAPPDWLEGLQPAAEAPVDEQAPPFVGEGIIGPPVPPQEPVAEVEEGTEDLARADIPDWLLALRPREPGEELAEEEGIVELGGPLAGIRGVLPVEPIITLPRLTPPETVVTEVPPVSGDLFAEIVAQPSVSTAAVPRRVTKPFVAGVQRVLIYVLLLAAVVVPILMETPVYGPKDAKELQAGGEAFYALLEGRGTIELPVDSAVVVAFDYNPATAAELSLQARGIVEHLMRRHMRIMAISLYPEGAALAWDVLDELAAGQGYVYGEDYIHLGYLPNQPASVRYFLNNGPAGKGQTDYRNGMAVRGYPVAQGVNDLSAVGLVVELAGDESTLRTWVEQITVRADVPVVAGVSAATAPYAWPYLDSGQLQALLVGLPGAAEYEGQADQQGRAVDSLGSQVAAQSVVVLLILLGNLVHLTTRGGKK
jgi:hypothetical protein